MIPAGERIDVRLRLSGGRVAGVDVTSGRTATAAAVLEGKTVDDALALLPLLFALCGVGQLTAGLRAVEAALDIEVSPQERLARTLLVAAETISEHATRMLVDWPMLAGLSPDIDGARRVRDAAAALQRVLYPDPRTRARLGGGATLVAPVLVAAAAELTGAVEAAVLDRPVASVTEADDLVSWVADAATTPAQVLRSVREAGFAAAGGAAPPLPPLPPLDPRRLAERLEATDVAAFLRAPQWDGMVFESGAFARAGGHRAVAAMVASLGPAVLPRLLARVVESALHVKKIVRLTSQMCDDRASVEGAPSAVAGAGDAAVRWGLGAEDAARGRLFHHVVVAQGRVARWRILAPTEWNFQSRGPVAAALGSLPANDDVWVRQAAEWLVMALDPCVACHVRVEEEGRGHA